MPEIPNPLKIAKNAPSWAIGVTSVLVAVGASLVTIYMTARPEISQYVTESHKASDKKSDIESIMLNRVLDLVTSNTNQITVLSQSITVAQEMNTKLNERISTVEKELVVVKTLLSKCELDLSKTTSRRTP